MGEDGGFLDRDIRSPWLNEDGDIVPPNAPRGRGGPGRFRYGNFHYYEYRSFPPVPHHQSAAARYRILSAEDKQALQSGPQNPPPKTKAETLTIRGVTVKILVDGITTDPRFQGKGNTPPDFTFTAAPGADSIGPRGDPDPNKRTITRLRGPPPVLTLTIQTVYGTPATATSPSGYGRGTTEPDKSSRNTSLGFHESCHRQDHLDFLSANAPPVFTGRVGITETEYTQAVKDFPEAVATYKQKMIDSSVANTDEVGKKKSEQP